jgi:hypothetical protein
MSLSLYAVFLKILSAGAVYAIINLGDTTDVNGAFELYNKKVGQVLDEQIIESCSNKLPVFDPKGDGSYTFTCDIDPTKGGKKSRKSRKTRRTRKSRRFRK